MIRWRIPKFNPSTFPVRLTPSENQAPQESQASCYFQSAWRSCRLIASKRGSEFVYCDVCGTDFSMAHGGFTHGYFQTLQSTCQLSYDGLFPTCLSIRSVSNLVVQIYIHCDKKCSFSQWDFGEQLEGGYVTVSQGFAWTYYDISHFTGSHKNVMWQWLFDKANPKVTTYYIIQHVGW